MVNPILASFSILHITIPFFSHFAILSSSWAIQVEDKSQDCQGWWRAMLARHGLYGPGDVIGAPELAELIAATLRYLRDRYAPAAFLRNLRTVHCGSKRLKEPLEPNYITHTHIYILQITVYIYSIIYSII